MIFKSEINIRKSTLKKTFLCTARVICHINELGGDLKNKINGVGPKLAVPPSPFHLLLDRGEGKEGLTDDCRFTLGWDVSVAHCPR